MVIISNIVWWCRWRHEKILLSYTEDKGTGQSSRRYLS